jgi:superfamily II DNA or RNA helicase
MGRAEAYLWGDRIAVRTVRTRGVDDFDFMLAACKGVRGGRYDGDRKLWHYPLSVDACLQLRRQFGKALQVHDSLATWYRAESAVAQAQTALSGATDATLTRVPERFANWLRPYQRAGAAWIAQGYRGAGLIADKPGVGKTGETLAAMLEANVQGPVLVLCRKKAVKRVWGKEARLHFGRSVPVYLCRGKRAARQKVLARFERDMQRDPNRLRIVVIVAEMLRVEMGNPCYTTEWSHEKGKEVPKNKVSGMCPAKRRGEKCKRHIEVKVDTSTKTKKEKNLVPVGFSYPELFNPDLLGGGWSWVIIDESHKLLGSLTVVRGNLMAKGLRLLPERESRRRYAMSGTPFGKAGRVQGFFGTLHWLWPDEFTSYWKWVADIFEVEEEVVGYDRYARAPKVVKKLGGLKGLPGNPTSEQESEHWERFLHTLGPRVLRRTKEETLKDLPPKSYYEVVCDMTPAQKRQWDELAAYAEFKTSGGVIACNGSLALATRMRQLALGELVRGPDGKAMFGDDSGKIDELWEHLETRGVFDGAPGDKLIIASRYNEFLDCISEFLVADDVPHFTLDGRTSEVEADRIMEAWQGKENRETRVMLVNVKAGGESLTLDAADEMHMMDEDPDPGVNEQMEDRIHRASRIHKVKIFYYRTQGTAEYAMAHDVEYRRRAQHAILDGRRGQEYFRELMIEAEGIVEEEEEVA